MPNWEGQSLLFPDEPHWEPDGRTHFLKRTATLGLSVLREDNNENVTSFLGRTDAQGLVSIRLVRWVEHCVLLKGLSWKFTHHVAT